ncbi:FecR domain-containing protein [Luteimonas sp. RD2P54]|uniref:FecR domain-containing protein n=1 Tax=Luteimonas endophytica TaxID=3042023 RepID=A0ABT6J964_9GAMM|nr:FecR domain-containing protein [Luteimonas endophytica]MDH5823360.1 FecR domain-containing protein [Luteimonas endophytica]
MGNDRLTIPQPKACSAACLDPRTQRRRWVLLLLVVTALASAGASAQDWRYRVRPGDTIWDISRAYLRQDVPWQRVQAYNDVADPWQLAPGTGLRIPVAWLRVQPAKATVIALHGRATTAPADAPDAAAPVATGMQLGAGTVLRTLPDANLTLRFADGSRLQLQGGSELHLDRLGAYGATGMVDTRMRLLRGRATNSVQRARGPASRFILDTPGTMATVRGTEFRIARDAGLTRSEVLEGRVRVDGGGRGVVLDPGEGTLSDAGGHPLPPRPLLPAPDLDDWPEELQRMPSAVAWPPVEGASGYRLQVGADPEFLVLLQDTLVDAPRAEVRVPGDGTFHARVRALDAHGLEGRDAVRAFRVSAQPAPPFAIAPEDGAATAGTRPRFRWTRSEGDLRYRLQVGRDPEFRAPLVDLAGLRRDEQRSPTPLPPGEYYWRVGATDGAGKHGPFGDPVRFLVQEADPGPAIGADGVERDGRALQVRWPAGEPGQRYEFQLSRDPDFSRIELERTLDENRIALPRLRAGTWHMRTRLVDDDGYAHPYGPTQSVRTGCLPCRIALGAGLLLLVL